MERRNQLRAAIVVHAAAQPRDRIERAQQRSRSERAQRHDDLRFDDVDLLEQERLACLDLVLLGISIPRRPAFDHIGDVHVFTFQVDRRDYPRQELAGPARAQPTDSPWLFLSFSPDEPADRDPAAPIFETGRHRVLLRPNVEQALYLYVRFAVIWE